MTRIPNLDREDQAPDDQWAGGFGAGAHSTLDLGWRRFERLASHFDEFLA